MSWAVVTGGSRGLGAATALALARAGHDLVVTYRSDRDAALGVAGQVGALGRECAVEQLALDDLAAVDAFAQSTSTARRPAVLVNNAGEPFPEALGDVDLADAERLLRVNTLAPLALVRGLAAALGSHERSGAVVNVSSVVARGGSHGSSVYAASKAALHGLTRTLAVELAPRIRVNAVLPGVFATDLNAAALADEARARAARELIPLGRVGDADECAAVVAFLASEAASYVTGTMLPIDGGVLARLALPGRGRAPEADGGAV